MEYHLTLLSQQTDIVLMRVENGWVIRTNDHFAMGSSTPLKVAETPAALVEIVRVWAMAASDGRVMAQADRTTRGKD